MAPPLTNVIRMLFSQEYHQAQLLRILSMFLAAASLNCLPFVTACEYEQPVDSMVKLETEVLSRMNEMESQIPEQIKQEIEALGSARHYYDLSEDAQLWLRQNEMVNTVEMERRFEREMDRYPHLRKGVPDLWWMTFETFWRHLKGLPLDLKSQLDDADLYWAEWSTPEQDRAPEGGAEIHWVWKLEVKSRRHGVVHVGVDVVTRRFVCYEYPRGLYYPEGNLLERIRAEIVQDPENIHIPIRGADGQKGRAIGDWREDEVEEVE